MLKTGDLILNNRFRIEKLAGKGAFAEVYRATHLELKVARAIKVGRSDAPGVGSTTFNDYRERYKQEFQIAARLDHPNVIKVYDLIEEQGVLYAVLEFAPNGSVKDLIAMQGALPVERAIQILLDCAAGLDALHEKMGVIHRDIKPSNILMDADGRAKIADLGLAQVGGGQSSMRSELGSVAGGHPGTGNYRSPEHNTWEPLMPTSDVYSLGCVAFEMLTGQVWKDAMRKAEYVHELRPDVPEWLDVIVARMLCDTPGFRKSDADNPNKRYVTMSAVASAVREEVDSVARQKREAEAKAKREAEERKRKEAEEQVRREAEAKAKREREEREKREAEEKAKRVAIAKLLAEEKNRQEAEQRAREQAEREAQRQREEQARIERERRASEEAELRNKWVRRIVVGVLVVVGIGWLVSNVVSAPAPTPAPTAVAIAPTLKPSATQIAASSASTPRVDDTRAIAPDNAPMVYVPGGDFLMGSNTNDTQASSDEKPQHLVFLDAFWIDKYEVTNALYKKCVEAGKCSAPSETKSFKRSAYYGASQFDNYPVIYVSWDDAAQYCSWAGKRLPTEAQWEKAARGTDGRVYPWGNSLDGTKLNSRDSTPFPGDTTAVGAYPPGASPYGAMDMAGNVWEWVADWYGENYYASSARNNPTGPSSGQARVVRGGSWSDLQNLVRAANRGYYYSVSYIRYNYLGLRCAQ